MFFPVRSNETELMDEAELPAALLIENFRDIRRINRYFGGARVVLRLLERAVNIPMIKAIKDRPLQLLDIATGAADIPIAIGQWAAARQLAIEITATDYSRDILAVASSTLSNYQPIKPAEISIIKLAEADARALQYSDQQFDIAVCSLALHHFTDEEAIEVLREMKRVARVVIINDLRRSLMGYLAAHVYGRLFTSNKFTRNDAPLSVLRAFTVSELIALAGRAGLAPVTIEKQPGWRLSMFYEKSAVN